MSKKRKIQSISVEKTGGAVFLKEEINLLIDKNEEVVTAYTTIVLDEDFKLVEPYLKYDKMKSITTLKSECREIVNMGDVVEKVKKDCKNFYYPLSRTVYVVSFEVDKRMDTVYVDIYTPFNIKVNRMYLKDVTQTIKSDIKRFIKETYLTFVKERLDYN